MNESWTVREVAGRTFVLVKSYEHDENGCHVKETTGGGGEYLTARIDLPQEEALTDEVLLALTEPRRRALGKLMEQYGITAGPDYQHEDAYELLYSTEPVGRYAQVSGDETYRWVFVCETREEAAEAVACDILGQPGDEYPRHPIEVRDLDTGRSIGWESQLVVTLED